MSDKGISFANKMNQKAQELGLTNTHYANPHGLDDPDHYTSALDNAKLGVEVMKHEEIRKIVGRYQYMIPGALGPRHHEHAGVWICPVPGRKTRSTTTR